jgi:D-3-phosphoglycerate dehydrogenase / 2-oxoglutarate reductase
VYTVVQTDRPASDRVTEDAVFEESGLGISFLQYESATEDEVIERCLGADALIVAYAPVTERVLDQLPSCVIVAFMATGFNSVDLPAASERGVLVTNTPDYCTNEVADHTMGFLLDLGRNISRLHRSVSEGAWDYDAAGEPGRICRQSLGLVGLGRIGSAVARRALGFGLTMKACDPYVSEAYMAGLGVAKTGLDEVLACDYVSLHCLLNDETRRIIDREALAAMKPEAFLINTARGACVDSDALAEALQAGRLAGAAVDVVDPEPLPEGHPLPSLPNVIITPHAAFLSSVSLRETREKACLEVVRALRGETPRYLCNPEVLEGGTPRYVAFAERARERSGRA